MKADNDGKKGMQIGGVAKKAGLSARTLRYYEELGLITPESRSQGGFRLYGQESLKRLELINHLKELGLPLAEIGNIFMARGPSSHDRQGIRRLLDLFGEKLKMIEARIATLSRMREEIAGTMEILRCCEQCEKPALLDAGFCLSCVMLAGRAKVPDTFQVLLRKRDSAECRK